LSGQNERVLSTFGKYLPVRYNPGKMAMAHGAMGIDVALTLIRLRGINVEAPAVAPSRSDREYLAASPGNVEQP